VTRVHQVSIYVTEFYRVSILRGQDLQGLLYVTRRYRISILRNQGIQDQCITWPINYINTMRTGDADLRF